MRVVFEKDKYFEGPIQKKPLEQAHMTAVVFILSGGVRGDRR